MIKKYPVADAEANFAGIINEVESGTTVHLTEENGSSAVVMMSLGEYHRLAHGWRPARAAPLDMDEIIARFQSAFEADGCTLEGWLDGIREESNGRGT